MFTVNCIYFLLLCIKIELNLEILHVHLDYAFEHIWEVLSGLNLEFLYELYDFLLLQHFN